MLFPEQLIIKEFKQESKKEETQDEAERVGVWTNAACFLSLSLVDDSLITQMSELLLVALQVLHDTADTYVSLVVCLRLPCT